MASEYLNWKFRDVEPDPLPPVLTPRQKWRNWWHYHKWHMAAGAAACLMVADIARSALGLGQIQPDYQIAYVGETALPDQTAAAVEEAFAALGGDANGDGQTVVQLHQYLLTDSMDENAEYAYANQITLMGDLEDCDSYFFLLEDCETFQVDYAVLAGPDGSLSDPEETPFSPSWSDCPALAEQDLGTYTQTILGQEASGSNQDLLDSLQLARQGFWEDRPCDNQTACDNLWNVLTKGADPA